MILIATDEAGYGPKLGPFVVAATVWRLPEPAGVAALAGLSETVCPAGLPAVSVADSKQVYRPGSSGGLNALETIVWAATRWIDPHGRPATLAELLARTSSGDLAALRNQPWFAGAALDGPFPGGEPIRKAAEKIAAAVLPVWRREGAELLEVRQRILAARCFNGQLQRGINKAQLLSETTADLVVRILRAYPGEAVHIYSDRHGGRAYYGGLLQHFLPDAQLQILAETARESHYQLDEDARSLQWRFTVKGDAFAPVSLASMFAKYTRERLMECFNAYWRRQHGEDLRPTAGYPVDAQRFLDNIAPAAARLQIPSEVLVRQR